MGLLFMLPLYISHLIIAVYQPHYSRFCSKISVGSYSIGMLNMGRFEILTSFDQCFTLFWKLECGPMPNMMVALPNIGGALLSMLQSLAGAHYLTAMQ